MLSWAKVFLLTKKIGDNDFCATINKMGVIQVEAEKIGKETTLSNIITYVRNA